MHHRDPLFLTRVPRPTHLTLRLPCRPRFVLHGSQSCCYCFEGRSESWRQRCFVTKSGLTTWPRSRLNASVWSHLGWTGRWNARLWRGRQMVRLRGYLRHLRGSCKKSWQGTLSSRGGGTLSWRTSTSSRCSRGPDFMRLHFVMRLKLKIWKGNKITIAIEYRLTRKSLRETIRITR